MKRYRLLMHAAAVLALGLIVMTSPASTATLAPGSTVAVATNAPTATTAASCPDTCGHVCANNCIHQDEICADLIACSEVATACLPDECNEASNMPECKDTQYSKGWYCMDVVEH